MMDGLELLFLGTGTSAGIPMIGCHCPVCCSSDPHDQRMRPSVVISYGNTRVLVDASPELRLQCVANRIDMIDAAVFTHGHADHIMGLDDIRRFNALKKGPLDIWADERTHAALTRCFGYAFKEPSAEEKVFRPHLIWRKIDGSFEIGGTKWEPIPLFHGDMPVLGFRVGRLAYCTDVNRIPESSFELLKDLDVLVLDALQHKRHTTHFSLEEAVAAAGRIGAGRTYFTHIAHALGHEATNAILPGNVRLAYDGLRVQV
ncbi:MAG TPA: MBL fold metallo-hydrolase [Tepidisphaeraceae bacterium]|jgi:phosphoribosyl 1,2-cyclic phosphate phosphodiesterase|nr:MBL fold metallo-hydrolase [Tepidisphaeraceae bacterium]